MTKYKVSDFTAGQIVRTASEHAEYEYILFINSIDEPYLRGTILYAIGDTRKTGEPASIELPGAWSLIEVIE